MPFDSLIVLPRHCGSALPDIWSDLTAERVCTLLASDHALRVVPSDRVQSLMDEEERTPEEIGRQLNVNAAAVCAVSPKAPSLDLELELIDVLAEAVIARQTFLSCVSDASTLYVQAARAIRQWLAQDDRRGDFRDDVCDYSRVVAIRFAAREGQFEEALDLCLTTPLANAGPALKLEIARAITEAPIALGLRDAAFAQRAIRGLACAEAEELKARMDCRFHHQWKRAQRHFDSACAQPDSVRAHASYAAFLIAMRRFDEARVQIRWTASAQRAATLTALLDALLSGDMPRVSQAMRAVAPVRWNDPYVRAQQQAMAGDSGSACSALSSAIAEFSSLVMFMAVDPAFHPLRKSRRFGGLLRSVGLD